MEKTTNLGKPVQEFRSPFGNALRKAREDARLSQRHLDVYSGVDHTTISKLEDGSRGPRLETAVRLGLGMGLSPEQRLELYESVLTPEQRLALRNGSSRPDLPPPVIRRVE